MTIENQNLQMEVNKFEEKSIRKLEKKKAKKPIKIFNLKEYDIFSYIFKNYIDTGKPTYSNELVEHFKLTLKQINHYLRKLEKKGFIWRLHNKCPKPIYYTPIGKKKYYNIVISLFPQYLQT